MKLMLMCGAGMSSSLLANKVNEAIQKRNLDVESWAISEVDVAKYVGQMDVVLVAPQIRFMMKRIKDVLGDVPIEVIDFQAYGSMNGDKIVDHGIRVYEQSKKK